LLAVVWLFTEKHQEAEQLLGFLRVETIHHMPIGVDFKSAKQMYVDSGHRSPPKVLHCWARVTQVCPLERLVGWYEFWAACTVRYRSVGSRPKSDAMLDWVLIKLKSSSRLAKLWISPEDTSSSEARHSEVCSLPVRQMRRR
jgi:hypothetical protein